MHLSQAQLALNAWLQQSSDYYDLFPRDKMSIHVRKNIIWPLFLVLTLACNRTGADAKGSFTADAVMDDGFPGSPRLTGKLYLSDRRLRINWGPFADVFDLTQRKGWRIEADTHTYAELADKDLTTYAPEMTNGSICPHANLPSACKLVGKEEMNGRTASKWDLLNPHGFHVIHGHSDVTPQGDLQLVVDPEINVTNLREVAVDKTLFELPSGYKRVERWW